MGMRSNHVAERDVLVKQLRDMYRDQVAAEEREWEKVMAVLKNNEGKYLTSSEISAAAGTELSVNEIHSNMIYNERVSCLHSRNCSHSSTLRNAIGFYGTGNLNRSTKTTTRKFVEVDQNGNIIPGSVIERTRSQVSFSYRNKWRG